MVRNKYYCQDWAPDGVDQNILEKALGNVLEPRGLSALKRLVKCPAEMEAEDTANIVAYLELQRIRVPRQADEAKRLAELAIETMTMNDPRGRRILQTHKVVMEDSFRIEFMRMMTGNIAPYLGRMVWEVVEAPEGSFFITSDSPVSFWNKDFVPPAEAGVALYGTIVFFPLDAKHLLIMSHPEYKRGEKTASERLPHDLEFKDGHIEIDIGRVLNRDAVANHCSVMYMLSQDLIAGCSKECIDAAVGEETVGHRPNS
ncbi:hypothetical protein MSSD14B_41940 [Marinobacter salsuginis]|uniref:DUF4238 domain-containing protein n=2 Tax=Marinobacter salsuginis TaxID=418719 RepID=A0A5M3Q5N8_9GAMM|nr:hypothetical protein MSSD14B_41940 [Marinobacter salsuginis]